MRNIKALKMTLLAVGLSVAFCFASYAAPDNSSNGPVSLEQLQEQAKETEAVIQETQASKGSNGSYYNDAGSAITNIAGSAKLDTESPEAQRIGNVMNSWAAKLMQILGYVISIGLGIVTALDITYIAIPPLRGILANGYTGTADTSGQAGGMPGGMGGGFGGGGFGGGGFGGGYGGTGGMQARTAMGNTANNQPAGGRTQFVTNAALNAVASASSGANPFKVYMKQQAVVLVMAPLIFVLAATGVLARFGFWLGQMGAGWAGNAMSGY